MNAAIIPAASAALTQILQGWLILARMSNMDREQVAAMFAAELERFKKLTPDTLPDT